MSINEINVDMRTDCRICHEIKQVHSLFDNFEMDSKLVKIHSALSYFLDDPVSEQFSQFVCESCINQLFEAYAFAMKVRKNEEDMKLLEIRNKNVVKILSDFNVEFSDEEESEYLIEGDEDVKVAVVENPKTKEIVKKTPPPPEIPEPLQLPCNVNVLKRFRKVPSTFVVPKFTFEREESAFIPGSSSIIYYMNTMPVEIEFKEDSDYKNLYQFSNQSYEDRVYACKYCEKAFSSEQFLYAHNRNCHLCLLCLKCFTSSKKIMDHTKSEHLSVSCIVCHNVQPNTSRMRQHYKINHDLVLPPYFTPIKITDREQLVN